MASKSIIAVVGSTASGKTDLGLELARRLDGEIISADSRQMYRHLNAGTAKPEGTWTDIPGSSRKIYRVQEIPYHLVDILDPAEKTDAGHFATLAKEALETVIQRGKRPIVIGGTGLYLRSLLDGLDPLPPRNPVIREELAELVEANGREWLHEELSRVDPEAARRIPPNNLHRVVRALEVYKITGQPISSLWSHSPSESHTVYLGIRWDRAALIERIRARCSSMFPNMLQEAARLVPAKYTGQEPGFQSLGYPEALRCLKGEISQEQALALMIKNTVLYAKRQATWFNRQVAVRWISPGTGDPIAWADQALTLLEETSSNASF